MDRINYVVIFVNIWNNRHLLLVWLIEKRTKYMGLKGQALFLAQIHKLCVVMVIGIPILYNYDSWYLISLYAYYAGM